MSQRKNDAIQRIKERLSLADLARRYVEVRNAGSRLVAPCPFHQETKPSFSINDDMGTFYCFGCQASGDIFDFYGKINGLDFRETLEALAEEAGVRLDDYRPSGPEAAKTRQQRSHKREMLHMHQLAAAHFASALQSPKGRACRDYVAERGLSPEVLEHFQLGWSLPKWQSLKERLHRAGHPETLAVECGLLSRNAQGRIYDRFRGRFMFPIFNLSGQVVAFGGRILPALAGDDDAKYINSSDSPIYKKGEHLYGLYQARKAITVTKSILLTEGYMDVVTLHQYGYRNAVGVLGTALTPEQVRRLSGFSSHLELLFDGDGAGRKAAFRACEMVLPKGLSCKVVLFPDNEDIDSLLRSRGKEAFEAIRAQALDGLDFCMEVLSAMSPREVVDWVRAFLAQVDMPELSTRFASTLAPLLGGNLDLPETETRLRQGVADARARKAGLSHADDPRPGGKTPRGGPQPPKVAPISFDREILTFAVRYPQRLETLREHGADLALSAPWARALWEKLEQSSGGDVFRELNDKEKQFWVRCRDGNAGAPPLDNEQSELDAILNCLETLENISHKDSVAAALRRRCGDYDTQREFLRALREARGRQGDQ